MARDPLPLMARLRRLEVASAQAALAEARLREADATARAAGAAATLTAEQCDTLGADYAAWLPRGIAARDAALRDATHAESRAAAALAALVGARTAERSVERLAETRAEAARRDGLRRAAIRLEEAYSASTPRRT